MTPSAKEIRLIDLTSLVPDQRHRAGLQWFADRAGQEVPWPGPLDGMFLVNKAKGIHKPKELKYALSIRQSLNGPYEDSMHLAPDGSWFLDYAYEGTNPTYFTNSALRACLTDKVPIGVFVQVKDKPDPRYKVLGLGVVVADTGTSFRIQQYGSKAARADAAVDVALPLTEFDASNLEDARRRVIRAMALRRGQPAFRKELIAAYGAQCAVTGCKVLAVLEAAHIVPYQGAHTNHVQNGLVLRADLHILFDLGLLSIDPETLTIRFAQELEGTEYWPLNGRPLRLPPQSRCQPSTEALRRRADLFAANPALSLA